VIRPGPFYHLPTDRSLLDWHAPVRPVSVSATFARLSDVSLLSKLRRERTDVSACENKTVYGAGINAAALEAQPKGDSVRAPN